MTTLINRPTILLLLLALGLAAGCQQQTASESADGHDHGHGHGHDHPHDHHHGRPATLHEAVAELHEISDEVTAAMEGGKPDDAHHPLHEVGELLEALPEIAADTDLPRDQWEVAKAETDKLFDAFGVIDAAFHKKDGDKRGAYDQVSAEITASIEKLEALLPLSGEKPPMDHDHAHDHDHDHGEDHAHAHDHDGEHKHDEDHDHDHDHDHEEGDN